MKQLHLFGLSSVHVAKVFKFIHIPSVNDLILDPCDRVNRSGCKQFVYFIKFRSVSIYFECLNLFALSFPKLRILDVRSFKEGAFLAYIDHILDFGFHDMFEFLNILYLKALHCYRLQ